MNFLQPWIVWALPLAVLPVLIHLIHKRRHRVVEWGAMMFLLDGAKMSRGRQRLREILLLIMRTLAVLGLIVGIGRPIAGGWVGRLGGEELDTVVLVIDRSASMSERVGGRADSKLVAGLRDLREALEIAGAGANVVVVDAVRPGRVVPLESIGQLGDLRLETSTAATSDLPAAFETATTYLRESAAGRAEIWALSDGQSTDWRVDDGRWDAISNALSELQAGVRVRLSLSPTMAADNLSVRVDRVRREVTGEGAALVLDVAVRRAAAVEGAGDTATIVPVAFEVGGARSSADVELIGREARLLGHRIPIDAALQTGFGSVELVHDARPGDDRFWFVFGERPTLETVVVTGRKDVARIASIAAELPFDPGVSLVARTVAPEDAGVEALALDGAAFVVWHAPFPEGDVRTALETFIDGGGIVLFLPADSVTDGEFSGVRFGPLATVPIGAPPLSPVTWRADDGVLRTGADGTPLPVGELEFVRTAPIESDDDARTDLLTLASFEGGRPLLVRTAGSGGAAYFLGTLPTGDAGNLASQGVVWVALVQRSLALAARARTGGTQRDAGPADWIDENWRSVTELGEGASLFERELFAGVVTDGERFIALNRAEPEDSAPAQPVTAIEERFGDVDVVSEEVRSARDDGSSGLLEEIWRVFMLMALVGLLAEALLCSTEGDAPPVSDGGRP